MNTATIFNNPNVWVEVGKREFPQHPNFVSPDYNYMALEFKQDYGLPQETVPKEDKTIVGFLGTQPIGRETSALVSFVMGCINSGLESPLYQEIREKRGLSYYSVGFPCIIGRKFIPYFASSTTNDRATELIDVYQNFFSQDFASIITRERFDECFADMLIGEKKDKILPHIGVSRLILDEFNPYDALRNLTYDDAVAAGNKYLNANSFVVVQH